MSKVRRHLLARQLMLNLGVRNWPYWVHCWDGHPHCNSVHLDTDVSDSGRLLYALDILREHDHSCSQEVQQVYQKCKTAYDIVATHMDQRPSCYGVPEVIGFGAFGCNKSHITTGFDNREGSFVDVEGQMLPKAETRIEPTLHEDLKVGLHGILLEYTTRVYEAHRARWEKTGRLSGWSEGGHPIHEFIYGRIPDTKGEIWFVT